MAGEITADKIDDASEVLKKYVKGVASRVRNVGGVDCNVYLAQEMVRLGIVRAGASVNKPIELFNDVINAYLDKSLTGSSSSSASGSPKQTRARVSVETLKNFIALKQNELRIRLLPDMLYYIQHGDREGEIIEALLGSGRTVDAQLQVFMQGYRYESKTIKGLPESGKLQYKKNQQLLLRAIRQYREKLTADNLLAQRIDVVMSKVVVPCKRKSGAIHCADSSVVPEAAAAAAASTAQFPRRQRARFTAQVGSVDVGVKEVLDQLLASVLNAIKLALEQLSAFNDVVAGRQQITISFMQKFYGGIEHILKLNKIETLSGQLLQNAHIVLGAIASTCIKAEKSGRALSLPESCIRIIFSLNATHPNLRKVKCFVMSSVMAIFDEGGQPARQMAELLLRNKHHAFLCGTFWEGGSGAASGSEMLEKARNLYQSNIAILVRKILGWADGLGADPLAQQIRFFFANMDQSQRLSAVVARVVQHAAPVRAQVPVACVVQRPAAPVVPARAQVPMACVVQQPAVPASAQVPATDVMRAAAEFVEAGGQAAVAGVVGAAAEVGQARAQVSAAEVGQAPSAGPHIDFWHLPPNARAVLAGRRSLGSLDNSFDPNQDNQGLSYEEIARLANKERPGFF